VPAQPTVRLPKAGGEVTHKMAQRSTLLYHALQKQKHGFLLRMVGLTGCGGKMGGVGWGQGTS